MKGEEVEPKEHESKMAIYKRGKVYWYEFVFNGERCRGSAETGDQRTARQREAHERLKLAKGEAGIETKDIPTLRAFSAEFMATIRMELAAKPRTVVFYQEKLDRLLENTSMADARLDVIDEGLIDGYKRARRASVSRRGKPLSPASVNRELATLRRLLRMAQDRKLITAPRVRLLKGEAGREFVLSREDEPRYLEALPGDMRPFCTFLIETGFRVGEALSLEWPQINLREKPGFVTVRAIHAKSSKTRSVPLTTRARAVLEAVDGRKGLVFRNAAGGALYHTWLDQQHAAIREALKLPADFVLHSLRHTFGTRLGEAGADSFTIMKLMGHSTVTVSQKYVHPSTESMRLAIERMGVLSVLPTNSPTVAKRKRAEKRVTTK